MRSEAVITIRLADAAPEFAAAALDLLEAVEESDKALVTDRIAEKAAAFQEVIDRARGEW